MLALFKLETKKKKKNKKKKDYIRREVHALDGLDSTDIIEKGAIEFGPEPTLPK
jgi:hypothetical protein